MVSNACAISKRVAKFDFLALLRVMSNSTDSDSEFALGRPVVLGPAVAVAGLLVVLLGLAVFLFARNRQARIARLRERIGLAESRVNALLRIQQVAIYENIS